MKCSFAETNFLDSEVYNAVTVSSQHADFLATNAEAFKPRYKTWRTAGCFEVTAANKGIVFRDDASTNLFGNIAEGTYTSIASFLTAVDAAFEKREVSI